MNFWRIFFASVWLINGLWCKVFDQVPRHREIVARILGESHSVLLTHLIGVGEVLFALWILTGIKKQWSAWIQILLVLTMNLIEFGLARDLLLFGGVNLMVALAYIGVVSWVDLRRTPSPFSP